MENDMCRTGRKAVVPAQRPLKMVARSRALGVGDHSRWAARKVVQLCGHYRQQYQFIFAKLPAFFFAKAT